MQMIRWWRFTHALRLRLHQCRMRCLLVIRGAMSLYRLGRLFVILLGHNIWSLPGKPGGLSAEATFAPLLGTGSIMHEGDERIPLILRAAPSRRAFCGSIARYTTALALLPLGTCFVS